MPSCFAALFGRNGDLTRTLQSIRELREAGIVVPLVVDGKAYMPLGLGITTTATAGKVSLAHDNVMDNAELISDSYCDPDSVMSRAAKEQGLEDASVSLLACAPGRLAVACVEAGVYEPFPLLRNFDDARSTVGYLLYPEWAGRKLYPITI